MAKIIGAFDNLAEAQAAAKRLTAGGTKHHKLSIVDHTGDPSCRQFSRQSGLKKSIILGIALGAGLELLQPHGGILYLAGHLTRGTILYALEIALKGMLIGAATAGTFDLLRRTLIGRTVTPDGTGQVMLLLDSDWVTVQRARQELSREQPRVDERLIEMVNRYGYEHQSFVLLYDATEVWWSEEPEAAVVYRRVGRVAIVGAAPLTARENLEVITRRFLAFCQEQNLDCLMLPIGAEAANIMRICGMGLLGVGESGYFKLPEWKPAGDRGKKVRAGVNQARRAGITVERYTPGRAKHHECTRNEVEKLCQQWIDTREVDALGWLLELDPFKLSEHKRYFLARAANGQLEGVLACSPIPARRGWYLEDLIRQTNAGRGVSELLVVEVLHHLASEGAELATLGTSPLANIELQGEFKILARLLKLIYCYLDAFYHFKALHRFKAKFMPSSIDPEYVAIWPPRIRLRMILAVISAFDPGGLPSVLVSKLKRCGRKHRNIIGGQHV